jgi:hypothetical protein
MNADSMSVFLSALALKTRNLGQFVPVSRLRCSRADTSSLYFPNEVVFLSAHSAFIGGQIS